MEQTEEKSSLQTISPSARTKASLFKGREICNPKTTKYLFFLYLFTQRDIRKVADIRKIFASPGGVYILEYKRFCTL